MVLAQWADETAWGSSVAWIELHNPAGIGWNGRTYWGFPSVAAGVAAWERVMLGGAYAGVRQAARSGPTAEAVALGRSPWAGSHYNNGAGPGSILLELIAANDLTRYDPAPAPSPAPEQEELPVPILVQYAGAYWVVSADLTTKVKVADPGDGSVVAALGYKVVALDAAQMAEIPTVPA